MLRRASDCKSLYQSTPLVKADPARAVQILTNLLVNALGYTPAPGCVEVSVNCEAGMIAFRMSETGVLTIAQSLAQAMGGEIRLESAGLGQGSSFTLTLPLSHE